MLGKGKCYWETFFYLFTCVNQCIFYNGVSHGVCCNFYSSIIGTPEPTIKAKVRAKSVNIIFCWSSPKIGILKINSSSLWRPAFVVAYEEIAKNATTIIAIINGQKATKKFEMVTIIWVGRGRVVLNCV